VSITSLCCVVCRQNTVSFLTPSFPFYFFVRPVVAAAAIVPANIAGIIDSKKITKEDARERMYEELIRSPGIRYAVAVVSAQRIDEINILQATLEGMRMAVAAVMNIDGEIHVEKGKDSNVASAERNDSSYVITGGSTKNKIPIETYHALIDGNKVPKDMPCPCESLVKGDGREYSIGAASILAKVTRDRLMHEYDTMYPKYNLSQHKGEHHPASAC
jgi:ribonuclease HII